MDSPTPEVLTERRIRLRDQLLRAGPEHTDMSHWYTTAGAEPYLLALEVRHAPSINIEECGTTACLAGHGALLMLPQVCQEPKDVADYFGLDEGVFDPYEWDDLDLDGTDGTFDEEVERLIDGDICADEPLRRARWSTLITYLDGLIKGEVTA